MTNKTDTTRQLALSESKSKNSIAKTFVTEVTELEVSDLTHQLNQDDSSNNKQSVADKIVESHNTNHAMLTFLEMSGSSDISIDYSDLCHSCQKPLYIHSFQERCRCIGKIEETRDSISGLSTSHSRSSTPQSKLKNETVKTNKTRSRRRVRMTISSPKIKPVTTKIEQNNQQETEDNTQSRPSKLVKNNPPDTKKHETNIAGTSNANNQIDSKTSKNDLVNTIPNKDANKRQTGNKTPEKTHIDNDLNIDSNEIVKTSIAKVNESTHVLLHSTFENSLNKTLKSIKKITRKDSSSKKGNKSPHKTLEQTKNDARGKLDITENKFVITLDTLPAELVEASYSEVDQSSDVLTDSNYSELSLNEILGSSNNSKTSIESNSNIKYLSGNKTPTKRKQYSVGTTPKINLPFKKRKLVHKKTEDFNREERAINKDTRSINSDQSLSKKRKLEAEEIKQTTKHHKSSIILNSQLNEMLDKLVDNAIKEMVRTSHQAKKNLNQQTYKQIANDSKGKIQSPAASDNEDESPSVCVQSDLLKENSQVTYNQIANVSKEKMPSPAASDSKDELSSECDQSDLVEETSQVKNKEIANDSKGKIQSPAASDSEDEDVQSDLLKESNQIANVSKEQMPFPAALDSEDELSSECDQSDLVEETSQFKNKQIANGSRGKMQLLAASSDTEDESSSKSDQSDLVQETSQVRYKQIANDSNEKIQSLTASDSEYESPSVSVQSDLLKETTQVKNKQIANGSRGKMQLPATSSDSEDESSSESDQLDLVQETSQAKYKQIANNSKEEIQLLAASDSEDEETSQKVNALDSLVIKIPWEIPPLHEGETRVCTQTKKERRLTFEKLGIPIKKGLFSKAEDDTIKHNFEHFCSFHGLKTDATPFIEMNKKTRYSLDKQKRIKFGQFIAHGLNDRFLYTVYKRFCKLYHTGAVCREGRFLEKEDSLIKSYISSTKDHKPIKEVALELNRSYDSVLKRSKLLSPCVRSKWSLELMEKYLNTLLSISPVSDIYVFKRRDITDVEYAILSEKMHMPVWYLRRAWKKNIYPKIFNDNLTGEKLKDIKSSLVDIIHKKKYKDWKEVNFSELAEKNEGMTGEKLYDILKQLIRNYVPTQLHSDFRKCILYIKRNKQDWLKKTHRKPIQTYDFIDGKLVPSFIYEAKKK